MADYLPSVNAVGALVRARTRDDVGEEFGTFTSTTRPTAGGVTELIASEAAIVLLRTGDLAALTCPNADEVRAAASSIIAKRVAAIVEASYRPDEVAEGRTVADFYQGDAKDDLEALAGSARECRAYKPGDDPADATRDARPRAHFPPPVPLRW